jgi:hypothetical protein
LRSQPHPHEHPAPSIPTKKRHRSPSEDDFSDSEETSSWTYILDSSEDSDDSNDTTTPQHQPQTPELRTTHVSHIADRAFPSIRNHITKAYYTRPPDYRIRAHPRKRRRRILLETEDPNDPSTVLIVRVDGYLPLACPVSPSRCSLLPHSSSLRSIRDVVRHLARHHRDPIYCPICGTHFDLELARDAHICARSCARREFEVARGTVSRAQLEALVERDDRNRPEEDRWWRIYRAVCPGGGANKRSDRGVAAYLGEGVPLAVAMARDYWDLHGRDMVQTYLADEGVVAGGVEITEQEVSVVCSLVGKELVQRVIDGRLESETVKAKATGDGGAVDEEEWESVKDEDG